MAAAPDVPLALVVVVDGTRCFLRVNTGKITWMTKVSVAKTAKSQQITLKKLSIGGALN